MKEMPVHTLLRASAVVLTVGIIFLTNGRTLFSVPWETFVYSFAFGHYVIGLMYSTNQIRQAAASPSAVFRTAVLILLGVFAYFHDSLLPLVLYFGVHHAFNEVYLLDRVTRAKEEPAVHALRPAGVAVNFTTYLFLLRGDKAIHFIPFYVLLAGVVSMYLFFFFRLRKAAPFLNRREMIDNCAAEIVSLIAILVSFRFTIRFLYIVAYHIVFWALRPLPVLLGSKDRAPILRYAGLTVLLTSVMYLVSPIGLWSYPIKNSLFVKQFIFLSYLHITISFALSDFHPRRISLFFRPSGAPAKS